MKRSAGIAMVEVVIATPIVLWLGLAAVQWGLVFHARGAVSYALNEAVRAGTLAGADPEAIDRGLARGLAPFLYGALDAAGQADAVARAQAHVAVGKAGGWITLRQLAPTAQSFADWAEPDVDDQGRPVPDRRVIPNDNLSHRLQATLPSGGIGGYRDAEPVGLASGQTLADANLLKVEMVYGVPLGVPFIGSLAAWALRIIDGCTPASARRLGTTDLGTPDTLGRVWPCAFYDAVDETGRPVARIPVRVSATQRMQSPARFTEGAVRRADPSGALSSGLGGFVAGTAPVASGDAVGMMPKAGIGAEEGAAAAAQRAPGWLNLGGQRDALALGACGGDAAP